jgi:hypothetical protein
MLVKSITAAVVTIRNALTEKTTLTSNANAKAATPTLAPNRMLCAQVIPIRFDQRIDSFEYSLSHLLSQIHVTLTMEIVPKIPNARMTKPHLLSNVYARLATRIPVPNRM